MKNINDVINEAGEVLNNAKLGNFEEVLSKTKTYAEKATKMSADRLEISRKKIELLDAKAKLTKAYEKFGKLSYAKLEDGEVSDDEVNSCIAEIELQKTRAEMLEEEIDALKAIFTEKFSAKNKENDVKDSEEDGEETVEEISVEEVIVEE